ncbi:MAG: cytochrome c peroxidase [Arcticibacterium sp.]|jgi:cytochrome c peroxidase
MGILNLWQFPASKTKKNLLRISKLLSVLAIASIFIAFKAISISDYLDLPETPFDYSVSLPSYFLANAGGGLPTSVNGINNTPITNPNTDHGATLGRVLFYDKNLSINRTIACASCHKQEQGFSDSRILSVGFEGGTTRRHSMTLINARYYQRGRFFWDERASTLEEQVLQPFQDPTEMGLTAAQISERVAEQSYYGELFSNAFGDGNITNERVSMALAQFVRSIVSFQSKYDTGRAQVNGPGANFPNFTALENQGKQLFLRPLNNGGAGCFGCHTTEAFVSANPGPQNNGLDETSTVDLGAGETFPQNALFAGRFKTSTLRNIALTAPYMHDGRFATLEEVVEHYNSGIQNHPTLSAALANPDGSPVRLNLDATQKSALVAFMEALTDNSISTEAKWSNPFCETNLCLEGTVDSGVFETSNSITNIANAAIRNGNYVNLISGKSIILSPNFEIEAGSVFKAEIGGCN